MQTGAWKLVQVLPNWLRQHWQHNGCNTCEARVVHHVGARTAPVDPGVEKDLEPAQQAALIDLRQTLDASGPTCCIDRMTPSTVRACELRGTAFADGFRS